MSDEFSYQITDKGGFFIVSFYGPLSKDANQRLFECIADITSSTCQYYIISFKNVTRIDQTVHRSLVQLQNLIKKEKKCEMKICGLNSKYKQDLVETGIMKNCDLIENILLAVQELNKVVT